MTADGTGRLKQRGGYYIAHRLRTEAFQSRVFAPECKTLRAALTQN